MSSKKGGESAVASHLVRSYGCRKWKKRKGFSKGEKSGRTPNGVFWSQSPARCEIPSRKKKKKGVMRMRYYLLLVLSPGVEKGKTEKRSRKREKRGGMHFTAFWSQITYPDRIPSRKKEKGRGGMRLCSTGLTDPPTRYTKTKKLWVKFSNGKKAGGPRMGSFGPRITGPCGRIPSQSRKKRRESAIAFWLVRTPGYEKWEDRKKGSQTAKSWAGCVSRGFDPFRARCEIPSRKKRGE